MSDSKKEKLIASYLKGIPEKYGFRVDYSGPYIYHDKFPAHTVAFYGIGGRADEFKITQRFYAYNIMLTNAIRLVLNKHERLWSSPEIGFAFIPPYIYLDDPENILYSGSDPKIREFAITDESDIARFQQRVHYQLQVVKDLIENPPSWEQIIERTKKLDFNNSTSIFGYSNLIFGQALYLSIKLLNKVPQTERVANMLRGSYFNSLQFQEEKLLFQKILEEEVTLEEIMSVPTDYIVPIRAARLSHQYVNEGNVYFTDEIFKLYIIEDKDAKAYGRIARYYQSKGYVLHLDPDYQLMQSIVEEDEITLGYRMGVTYLTLPLDDHEGLIDMCYPYRDFIEVMNPDAPRILFFHLYKSMNMILRYAEQGAFRFSMLYAVGSAPEEEPMFRIRGEKPEEIEEEEEKSHYVERVFNHYLEKITGKPHMMDPFFEEVRMKLIEEII